MVVSQRGCYTFAMIRRFEMMDAMTPNGGTAISEWMRLADILADGCSVHEVRNLLACLIGIRYVASGEWTAEHRARDLRCENQLRLALRAHHHRLFVAA